MHSITLKSILLCLIAATFAAPIAQDPTLQLQGPTEGAPPPAPDAGAVDISQGPPPPPGPPGFEQGPPPPPGPPGPPGAEGTFEVAEEPDQSGDPIGGDLASQINGGGVWIG